MEKKEVIYTINIMLSASEKITLRVLIAAVEEIGYFELFWNISPDWPRYHVINSFLS